MPGNSAKGALVAADTLAVGRRRRRALDDDDLALAIHIVEQIACLAISDLEIVSPDIGDEISRQWIGDQHHWDFGVVELLHGIDHGDVVDRDEDDCVRPILDYLIYHRLLFVEHCQAASARSARPLRRFVRAVWSEAMAEGFIGRVGQVSW